MSVGPSAPVVPDQTGTGYAPQAPQAQSAPAPQAAPAPAAGLPQPAATAPASALGQPQGAATPDDPFAAYGLDAQSFEALAKQVGYFPRQNIQNATRNLQKQNSDLMRDLHAAETQMRQLTGWRESVLGLLQEQGIDVEALENHTLRFERDFQAKEQERVTELQQFHDQTVETQRTDLARLVLGRAFDEQGQQLFNPQDPDILQAGDVYMQWVSFAAYRGEEHEAEWRPQLNAAGAAIRRLLDWKRDNALRGSLPATPDIPPQATPANGAGRGLQLMGTRGGGGQPAPPNTKAIFDNALAQVAPAGQPATPAQQEQAFLATLAAKAAARQQAR